ncbi:UDP-glucose--hexose-1-phosphate uridylyltransferase [Anaerovibrio sp.]|uniref:UDP-glucose--hexose-1-phosphate uridylyltransferase n=1 Tax=Anaerovibrio sp. TaxID=1872532 RepID=UPI003F14DB0D
MNHEINRLLNFALQQGLIKEADVYYSANLLLAKLQLDEFVPEEVDEALKVPDEILGRMLDYAADKGIIEDTANQRDLFDTALMNCVMPRPSEVIASFKLNYAISPELATENYYRMSIASNYIRKSRIDKNVVWKTATEYGDLDITINLSKPEKDPRDIAKAKLVKSSSYPKCLLCRENEGFAGHANHPARQTHRLIPLDFRGKEWFLQYSPYTYYNEHCIILNGEHVPMKISRATFENLTEFVTIFPHYFAGSNADLPIVGGSILSHDHYQGGHYTFAMAKAPVEKEYEFAGFPEVQAGRIKWPMSALRLTSDNRQQLIDLAEHILNKWRQYSDESVGIFAYSGEEPHNTITPICRRQGSAYQLDLVLRNNRTDAENPLGIFHPHANVHHIKKENIGLIEVMGLAVLPPRLKENMAKIKDALLSGRETIADDEQLAVHADWYQEIRAAHPELTEENVGQVIRDEIGRVFMQVLTDAGVFKRDADGLAAFDRFIEECR